jgi:predicted oxidoreductase
MKTIAGVMKWGVWGANLHQNQIEALIMGCIGSGINTFDHADIYGGYTTEKSWGNAWKNLSVKRENIHIITKCGICYPCPERPQYDIKHYNHSKEHIIASTITSIKSLHCEYLDTLLIHRPSPIMDPREMVEAFSYLIDKGLIRQVGVSNFTVSQMELLRSVYPIAVNQVEVSLTQMGALHDGTIDYCMQHNIEVQAWSPLGGGQLFMPLTDVNQVQRRKRLMAVADIYGWSLDEMAYLFLNHLPSGIRPVTGSSKLDRILLSASCESKAISDVQWYEIWSASMGNKVP